MDSETATRILAEVGPDDSAARTLLPFVYDELRKLAAKHLNDERCGHTLQPTALVNEAFVKMAGSGRIVVADRTHFFRLASKVMRQVLVDHARSKSAAKRKGLGNRVTLSDSMEATRGTDVDLMALEESLQSLADLSPQKAQLVELRYFGGLTIEEAATVLGISRTQATREWRVTRAWLADELSDGPKP